MNRVLVVAGLLFVVFVAEGHAASQLEIDGQLQSLSNLLNSIRRKCSSQDAVQEQREAFRRSQAQACDYGMHASGSWCRRRVDKQGVSIEALLGPDSHDARPCDAVWDSHAYSGDHCGSRPLAEALLMLFQSTGSGQTVGDLGCGPGFYARFFAHSGLLGTVRAYDGTGGDPVPMVEILDLSADQGRPDDFLPVFDWVNSLEVGEHIPPASQDNFLNTVTSRARKGLVLSWAVPGQGGHGHLNEKPNNWVIHTVEQRGFEYQPEISQLLRQIPSFSWFHDTLMVFHRVKSLPSDAVRCS